MIKGKNQIWYIYEHIKIVARTVAKDTEKPNAWQQYETCIYPAL